MNLKKPSARAQKKEGLNKKVVYWVGGVTIGIILVVAVLLIFNI